MQLNTVTLGEMRIHCVNPEEVPIIYNQVQGYFKHGIHLKEGDIVFDVGANIGLFSLMANQQCRSISIYAFEPVPLLFEALNRNFQQIAPSRLRAFPFGLGRENVTVTFACHGHATAMSTAYPYTQQEKEEFQQLILNNSSKTRQTELQSKLELIFETEPVQCQLRTASEVIQEINPPKIDLLKIDVEKAEMDVILGFTSEDWLKIHQIVIEIHNLDNRLDTIQSLLSQVGFNILAIDQDNIFQGSNIYNLYASR